jgi:F-type H+-transporting ATPase subunit a
MIILVGISLVVRRSLQMVPAGGQNVFEALLGGMLNFIDGVMGPKGRAYFPLLMTLGLYIFASNLMGLIPGMFSPTANINTTASCAITVFLMTHYVGFKTHGMAYGKQFTGPIWWLAPLMVVIEIIGHLARPLSLSVRLFGNIFGKEQVIVNIFFLGVLFKFLWVPMVLPSLILVFGVFLGFIQAFVFVLLSMIYLAGALEEHH